MKKKHLNNKCKFNLYLLFYKIKILHLNLYKKIPILLMLLLDKYLILVEKLSHNIMLPLFN
jgi:hypothetical protein